MNIHKLTPPRDCPKCGYEGNFRGPYYRQGYAISRRMVWECKACGFEKGTVPLDEAEQREEEAKKSEDISEWRPIKTVPDDAMVLTHRVSVVSTCLARRVDLGEDFPWAERFCWVNEKGDSILKPTYWKPIQDLKPTYWKPIQDLSEP